MPDQWKCPACSEAIRHDHEEAPRQGVIYRCHVCRLELVLDPKKNKLVLAPLPPKT
jgi:rubredoxin